MEKLAFALWVLTISCGLAALRGNFPKYFFETQDEMPENVYR
jgi:hypothetical protein